MEGHFDYGNGYHGRLYLNPHQLFRYPSTIWRVAQDLIDLLPAGVTDDGHGGGRSGHRRRAAGAHDRRIARRAPAAHARPLLVCAAASTGPTAPRCCRRSMPRVVDGAKVLLVDDVRNTGQTFKHCADLIAAAGGHGRVHGADRRPRRGRRHARRAERVAGRLPGAREPPGGGVSALPPGHRRHRVLIVTSSCP